MDTRDRRFCMATTYGESFPLSLYLSLHSPTTFSSHLTFFPSQQRNGLLYNYLNETSSFFECSGTALLSSATFRLSTLSSTSTSPSLVSAEQAYQTLLNFHLSPSGVLAPVVDPMDYSSQLQNVKNDASGNVSPEGEAFVLLMESARRDWIEEGGSVEGLMAGGGTSAAEMSRTISMTLLIVGAAFVAGVVVL